MSKKNIIQKLKKACKERKITESQLAREIKYSPSYINYLFSGENRYPPSDEFVRLAEEWLNACWVCETKWSETKKGQIND